MRRFGIFWLIFTAMFLILCTMEVFAKHPEWLHLPTGLWIILLALAYFAWYSGYWWYFPARAHKEYFHSRMIAIRMIYWFGLLGLTLALNQLDSTFGNMMWVVFGTALGMLRLPWNFVISLIPIGFILASWNIFPHANTLEDWLTFLGSLLSFAAYVGLTVMFSLLIQQRFQREALFHRLEVAHEQLRQAHIQLEDSAEHERELAVLRERERLSREMHDTLGHALVLTTVKLEAARRLMDVDPARADHEIGVTQDIVRQAMSELRATLATLRDPATAGCDPFTVQLERHACEIGERAGIAVTCDIAPAAAQWPKEIQTTLLRVGAEAMNNVEHHAQAQHMTLTIAGDGEQGLLRVADDGVGLPALPVTPQGEITSPAGHLGLAGMRERVAALSGALTIISAPRRGTSIEVRLPLASDQPAAPDLPVSALVSQAADVTSSCSVRGVSDGR